MSKRYLVGVLAALCLLLVMSSSILAASLTVLNADFETLLPGATREQALSLTPYGWVASGAGNDYSVTLSDKVVYQGNYSMEILVQPENDPWGVHVACKPIPVVAGKTYTVNVTAINVVNEAPYTGKLDLYVEFWPDGGWWGEDDYWAPEFTLSGSKGIWNGKNRIASDPLFIGLPSGDWTTSSLTVTAPEGAKWVTVSFWTSRRTLRAYVDGIEVIER
ncbi:MAG TPA: hypothetical protein GXZ82_08740 [Firmicutes bacterium]|jgi:hypothetical protein|nr:hypothetical protein [Bacillota bacterium]